MFGHTATDVVDMTDATDEVLCGVKKCGLDSLPTRAGACAGDPAQVPVVLQCPMCGRSCEHTTNNEIRYTTVHSLTETESFSHY